jgi:multisubunit Na+/H+ antiporter MnhG subunit
VTEIELINSPLITIGAMFAFVASLSLLRYYRDKNTAAVVVGFFVLLITSLLEKYCVQASMLSVEVPVLSDLCGPAVPHVKGIGLLLIGIGLVFHVMKLEKEEPKDRGSNGLYFFIKIFVSLIFMLVGIYSLFMGHIIPAAIIILMTILSIVSLLKDKSQKA